MPRHAAPAGVLAAYLAAGGNKAEAAKPARTWPGRPSTSGSARIERILGTAWMSAESRTSLHVALLALEAARSAPAR